MAAQLGHREHPHAADRAEGLKVKSHLTTARLYGHFCCCSACQAAEHAHSIPPTHAASQAYTQHPSHARGIPTMHAASHHARSIPATHTASQHGHSIPVRTQHPAMHVAPRPRMQQPAMHAAPRHARSIPATHAASRHARSRRNHWWSEGKGLQLRKELKTRLQPKDGALSKLGARKKPKHPGAAEIREMPLSSSCDKQPLVINFVPCTSPAAANPPRKHLRCHPTAKTWRYGAPHAPGEQLGTQLGTVPNTGQDRLFIAQRDIPSPVPQAAATLCSRGGEKRPLQRG